MKDFIEKFKESLHENLINWCFRDLARKGAELMLRLALEAEISEFIEEHSSKRMPNGQQRIVRNGYHGERLFQTCIGDVLVKVPRSRDRKRDQRDQRDQRNQRNQRDQRDQRDQRESKGSGGKKGTKGTKEPILYQSQLIPKYLRRSENIEDFLPFLYLQGVSSTRMSDVLSQLVGRPVSFSPGSLSRLKEEWEQEYKKWNRRDLTGKKYVYWWVDGIYFKVRLSEEKICVLVIIGADADGQKELVAMDVGYRESELTWHDILLDLKQRGLSDGPSLAVGDGSLGFWNALAKVYPSTVHQRCWVHRTRNILDKLPKSLQSQAKKDIHEIYQAPTKQVALNAFDRFVKVYEAKYPRAVACLLKTKDQTLAFYDFPAEHWRHIRSTNVIESTFSTVRLRTYKTRGCCKEKSILSLVFKLVESASQRWQKLHSSNIIPLVLAGMKYQDGVLIDVDKANEYELKAAA